MIPNAPTIATRNDLPLAVTGATSRATSVGAARAGRRLGPATLAALVLLSAPAAAQAGGGAGGKKAPSATRASAVVTPSLVGSWSGTATIPLKDSSIVVPVLYTFTQAAASAPIVGTAMVPGQGSGPISHVVREGTQVRYRVTAPEGRVLEHDATLSADGVLDGTVSMDGKPLARFRVTPRKDGVTTR
jgi:hypothetical protein